MKLGYSKIYDVIDGLNVSNNWKKIFKKVHVTYYHNYYHGKMLDSHFWTTSKEVSKLLIPEKIRLFTRFNPWGFVLGPIYYLLNKLYLKGFILLAIFLLLAAINDATRIMIIFLMLYCAAFINVDFFTEKVLKNAEVVSNPLLLGDDADNITLLKLMSEKPNFIPLVLVVIVALIPFGLEIFQVYQNNIVVKKILTELPVVCASKNKCISEINANMYNINGTKNKKEISKYYYLIAGAYYAMGDRYNAINSLDVSLSFDEKNTSAYLLRAKIMYQRREYGRSILDYKAALKLNPGADFLNYYIGLDFYEMSKYEEALKYFKKATAKNKEAAYFEAQAYTKYILLDKKGAIKDAQRALSYYQKQTKGVNNRKILQLQKYIVKIKKEL